MENLNALVDMFTAQLSLLLVLAGTVERVTEYVKLGITSYTKKEIPGYVKQILVLAVSILFCLITETQFNVGLKVPPYVNEVIAGILISFGSDTLHSLLNVIKSIKDTNEAKTANITSSTTILVDPSINNDNNAVG
jgi:hypothetical protein